MDNIDWIKAFRLVFIISVNNHTEIINKDINRIDESYEKDVEDYVLNRRETGKSWKNLTINERNEYEDWENYYYSEDIVNDKYHPDIFWNSLCIESPALHHYRVHATWEGAKPPYTLGGGSEVMDAEEEENIDDIFVEIWIKIWRYGLSDIGYELLDESTSQFEQQWNIINVDKIINEFVWLICGPVESIEIPSDFQIKSMSEITQLLTNQECGVSMPLDQFNLLVDNPFQYKGIKKEEASWIVDLREEIPTWIAN